MRIYVAGPVSKGDQFLNCRAAYIAAAELMAAGHEPFVPHLSFPIHMLAPQEYERWMQWDFAWLAQCEAILRLDGESPGADREVAEAERLGLALYFGNAGLGRLKANVIAV